MRVLDTFGFLCECFGGWNMLEAFLSLRVPLASGAGPPRPNWSGTWWRSGVLRPVPRGGGSGGAIGCHYVGDAGDAGGESVNICWSVAVRVITTEFVQISYFISLISSSRT